MLKKFVTLLLALEYGRTQMTKNILFEEDSASHETNTNRLGSQKKFFPHNNNNSYKGKKRHSWKITDISREKGFEFSPTERIWTQTSLRRNLFFSFGKNQQKKHKNIKTQEKSKKNIKSKIIQKKVFIKMHHQFIFNEENQEENTTNNHHGFQHHTD